MSGAKKFLAFDIGGTKIAHALTDSRGCLLEEPQRDATPRDNDEIFRLLQEIVRRYEAEIDGVAIATAGEADLDNRRIISSVGNMPKGYMDTVFEKLTSKPVYVENDANAALWGEYCCGAAKGCRNVMLVAIAELRGADRHGDDLVHREQRSARDVRAEGNEVSLAQQRPHGRDARADVDIRPCAVRRDNAMLAHRLALARIGVDTVRHHGVVIPQPCAVIALPILRAVGAELFDPRDLAGIFREVRLDIEPALAGERTEPAHQLVAARGGEARR